MSVDPPIPPEPPDLSCTVDDVAAIIRTRTKDSAGNELGTFDDTTRPTADQCQQAIDHQVVLVHTKVGYVGDMCSDLARGVVAIGAAAEIELSYFPEQSRSDRSIYTYLIQRYDAALDGLAACVMGDLPNCASSGIPDAGAHYRYATLLAESGVVADYYTGVVFPPIPVGNGNGHLELDGSDGGL